MKRIATLLVLLALSGCADFHRVWDSPENLRVAFHVSNAADVATTSYGLAHGCVEANRVAGPEPSPGTIIGLGAIVSLIYEGIYWHLEDEDAPLSERLAFGRMFLLVKSIGPVANTYTLSKGCN